MTFENKTYITKFATTCKKKKIKTNTNILGFEIIKQKSKLQPRMADLDLWLISIFNIKSK